MEYQEHQECLGIVGQVRNTFLLDQVRLGQVRLEIKYFSTRVGQKYFNTLLQECNTRRLWRGDRSDECQDFGGVTPHGILGILGMLWNTRLGQKYFFITLDQVRVSQVRKKYFFYQNRLEKVGILSRPRSCHFRFKEIFGISANGGKLLLSLTFSFLSYFLAAALMSCVFKPNIVSLVNIFQISSYVATVAAEITVTPVHASN